MGGIGLEPFIYEKDFTRAPQPQPEQKKTFSLRKLLIDNGFSEKPYMKPRVTPYVVDPEMKKNFEEMIPLCEEWAKRWGGHIRASIDHDKHDAYIVISGLRFFEFNLEGERQFLSRIAVCSTGVTFMTGDPMGTLKLCIYFPYYRAVISEEEEQRRLEDFLDAIDDILPLISSSDENSPVSTT